MAVHTDDSPKRPTVARPGRAGHRTAGPKLLAAMEASLDPLVAISPEGKITDVNEAAVRVTGVPRAGLVGTDFSDYFTTR